MQSSLKQILEQANALITAGDYEGFMDYCTPDSHWEFVGETVLEGKTQILQYLQDAYLEPPKLTVEHLVEEADLLTAVGTISMTTKDGSLQTYDYCDVWRFRDGKMAELKAFVIKP